MNAGTAVDNTNQLRIGPVIDWNKSSDEIIQLSRQPDIHTFAHSMRIFNMQIRDLHQPGCAGLDKPGDFKFLEKDDKFIARTGSGFVEITGCSVMIYKYPGIFSSPRTAFNHFGLTGDGCFTQHEHETFEASYAFSKAWAVTAAEFQLFDYEYFTITLSRCRGFEKDLVETFGLKPGDKVLDYGCGTAWFPYLMAETGVDSYGFDLFPMEYYPPFLKEKAHLFQADGVALKDIGRYDLIFIRGLTIEHHERNFNDRRWTQLFEGLQKLLSEKGYIYWIMYNNVSRVKAFDEAASKYFPCRYYRCSGYHVAILSNQPFKDHRQSLIMKNGLDIENIYARGIDYYCKYFSMTFMKAVFTVIDNYYRFVEYSLERPLAIAITDIFGEHLRLHLRWLGLVNNIELPLEGSSTQPFNIMCWEEDKDMLAKKYPGASLMTVTKGEIVQYLINPDQWLVSKDQDTVNLTEFLNYAVKAQARPAMMDECRASLLAAQQEATKKNYLKRLAYRYLLQ